MVKMVKMVLRVQREKVCEAIAVVNGIVESRPIRRSQRVGWNWIRIGIFSFLEFDQILLEMPRKATKIRKVHPYIVQIFMEILRANGIGHVQHYTE